MATFTSRRCPGQNNALSYATEGCVPAGPYSQLTSVQRDLINLGCSNPVHWTAPNAWAYAQMCPETYDAVTYVTTLGWLPGSDHTSHVNASYCDAYMPEPPHPDYFWAVVSEDPTCGAGGCMVTAW